MAKGLKIREKREAFEVYGEKIYAEFTFTTEDDYADLWPTKEEAKEYAKLFIEALKNIS